MPQEKSGKTIQSVQRAIDIINCFDGITAELSLNQISQKLNLNKSTVYGLLNTLHQNGFVCQNSEGKYLLGQALFSKAQLARGTNRSLFVDIARPYMETLSIRYQSSTNLFVIEDGLPIVLHRVLPANAACYVVHHISSQDPPYCTASGKITLACKTPEALDAYFAETELLPASSYTITSEPLLRANLEAIRRQGYSYEKEELAEGVSAVSTAIRDQNGALYGTISVSGVASHIEQVRQALADDLKQAGSWIADALFTGSA